MNIVGMGLLNIDPIKPYLVKLQYKYDGSTDLNVKTKDDNLQP